MPEPKARSPAVQGCELGSSAPSQPASQPASPHARRLRAQGRPRWTWRCGSSSSRPSLYCSSCGRVLGRPYNTLASMYYLHSVDVPGRTLDTGFQLPNRRSACCYCCHSCCSLQAGTATYLPAVADTAQRKRVKQRRKGQPSRTVGRAAACTTVALSS